MEEIVHLRIKKGYAFELIEDLIRVNALEPVLENEVDISKWEKEAVLNTLRLVEQQPEKLQAWDEIKKKYQQPK